MSHMRPSENLVLNLSSSVEISLGGLSEVITICLLCWYKSLNVWKNSSCVDSLPITNCMSSMRRTSTFLYFSLNFYTFLSPIAFMISFVNVSEVTYKTLKSGLVSII